MPRYLKFLALSLLLLGISPAADEKRLAVYTAQTSFTISVLDHDGQEYVSVTDLVDPFGSATLTHKNDRWKLKLAQPQGKAIEAEFRDGLDTATVRGKTVHLARAFWADGQRGYVPVTSTAVLMAQLTHQSTNFRENSRRLFVGDVSTTYTSEIPKGSPNKLVLHFSSPVNPEVSTEPGRVRLRFNRDPLIPSGANPQTFESPEIRSSTFTEANGGSEIAIATTTPTQPTFSDGGRTITLTAALPATQAAAVPAERPVNPVTSASPAPATTSSTSQPGSTTAPSPAPPRFVVIIDAAHGGDDPGATLGDGLLEKDVTMAIARRIRADLDQLGIATILLRDGDSTLTLDQRAVAANAAHAALYLGIHATTFGTGVHLYSARFNGDVKPANHGFLPWDSAQSGYLNASHNLEASLVTELESRQIHSMPLESRLRPLRNVAKPAIVVEVAEPEHPPGDVKEGLSSVSYQQAVATAVGSGIANLRGTLEVH